MYVSKGTTCTHGHPCATPAYWLHQGKGQSCATPFGTVPQERNVFLKVTDGAQTGYWFGIPDLDPSERRTHAYSMADVGDCSLVRFREATVCERGGGLAWWLTLGVNQSVTNGGVRQGGGAPGCVGVVSAR
jgi:hypothetical protein